MATASRVSLSFQHASVTEKFCAKQRTVVAPRARVRVVRAQARQDPQRWIGVNRQKFSPLQKSAHVARAVSGKSGQTEDVQDEKETGEKKSAKKGVVARKGQRVEGLFLGVPRESEDARVAASPEVVTKYCKLGIGVMVESGAGEAAGFSDKDYLAAGAQVVSRKDVWACDVVTKLKPPTLKDVDMMKQGGLFMGFVYPSQNPDLVKKMEEKKISAIGMDMIPRQVSRAQSFDALSSMANVAGYRAVVEAAHHFGRMFTGQITAAGRSPPAKVLVIGAGVAGLAAISAAKSMGAVVRCFDTRPVCQEQVESLGAEWIYPALEEDGTGEGGYAKQMSQAFIDAEMELFAEQAKDVDIIITTALIPGRKAPILITKDMVNSMKAGSVTVDLAAEAGGNVETTTPGKVVKHGDVTCIGYTDLPARMPAQSSTLYANNISNFFFSMTHDVVDGKELSINHDDVAVRHALIVEDGALMWPPPPVEIPAAKAPAPAKPPPVELTPEEKLELTTEQNKAASTSGAALTAFAGTAFLAMGAAAGDQTELTTMLSVFALAVLVGRSVVMDVPPALHSPLMSVTNAISGVTAIGGLLCMGGGLVPETPAQSAAALAVFLSAINIGGGFLMTGRMLDMFKRPQDAPEFNEFYTASGLMLAAVFAALGSGSNEGLTDMAYLLASLSCVFGIAGLSTQRTARKGNAFGMIGVALGLVATLASVDASPELYGQMAILLGAGGTLGVFQAKRTAVTALPQLVAAFHSLVGLAATLTSYASFMTETAEGGMAAVPGNERIAIFAGALIGALTLTGSMVAFGKLSGRMSGRATALPGKNYINGALLLSCAPALATIMTATEATPAMGALGYGTTVALALGWLGAAGVGGGDMPVIITLLNSSSGWALCAEGFVLNNEMLTVVGALIGASGAILSGHMCHAMNRSLVDLLFSTPAAPKKLPTGEAVEEKEAQFTSVEALADQLVGAKKVVVVPGYGLAVANGQGAISEVFKVLKDHGVEVAFGVHPVAGRMPGQLNVLLAEAGVPYEAVFEMDEINEMMPEVDVAIVVGANDTVNSAAEEDPDSVLAGMPVIRVWQAKSCVIMKRSMAQGYAAVENPLFFKDNSLMLLGDAKATCDTLLTQIRQKVA